MILRVRSNVGVWRVELGDGAATATVATVRDRIRESRPHVVFEQPLCRDPACREPLDETAPLFQQGLARNGAMVHCRVDPATTVDVTAKLSTGAAAAEDGGEGSQPESAPASGNAQPQQQHMRRVIGKDGSIQLVPASDAPAAGSDRGFRKGMLPLRDMKMHWTLTDFVAMDSQYEFKIQRQESAVCRQVSLDVPSITEFQTYVQRFAFQRKRFGFLYGKFVPAEEEEESGGGGSSSKAPDDKEKTSTGPTKCRVEAIYEPPQEIDSEAAEGFVALDDPQEDKVAQIAELLGLQKVGWIFAHEPREKGFALSAAEIIMAAEFQLEAADGVNETPFVTVTVAPSPDGTVSVEAFQVSQQCMAMVAEEALEVDPGGDPKICVVNETFTAIQEGKQSKTVENSFFLTVVPIVQHTSELFVAEFPRLNRDLDERTPSKDEMKRQLQKSGTAGWTFVDRLADFNLLLFLSQFLDVDADFPKICAAIVNRDVPLDDGYKLIIKSLAGIEGSY